MRITRRILKVLQHVTVPFCCVKLVEGQRAVVKETEATRGLRESTSVGL